MAKKSKTNRRERQRRGQATGTLVDPTVQLEYDKAIIAIGDLIEKDAKDHTNERERARRRRQAKK